MACCCHSDLLPLGSVYLTAGKNAEPNEEELVTDSGCIAERPV